MMWALKVTRSTMAATRRGSGNTVPHSLKGRLVAIATEARSSRSVMIWKSNSAPRGSILDVSQLVEAEQIQASVAGHDAGQDPCVGGFDELVDQLCGGDVADPAALFAGSQPEPYEQVGLSSAGVTEQHHGLAGVHVVPAGQLTEDSGRDSGDGVDVEVRQAF